VSFRDVEESLAERGVQVDHVTVYRWVQRFTPLFADAARFCQHSPGDRWFVDETYIKVAGVWRMCTGPLTNMDRSSMYSYPTSRRRRAPSILRPRSGRV